MLASRSVKPKLSLNMSTVQSSGRPSLSIKSPITTMPRTPVSPSPCSPTAHNTRLNQRGFSTVQQSSSFAYSNSSSQRSILKKGSSAASASAVAADRRLQFRDEPTVHAITPIENGEDYYGAYTKMSRDERRWSRK